MANTLYLSHLAEAKVRDLSSPHHEQVMRTLEALELDPLGNSKDLSKEADLRIARTSDFRVILRYVPAEHAVLVTDIASAESFEAAA